MRRAQTDDSYKDGGLKALNRTTVTRMATPQGAPSLRLLTLLKRGGVGGGGGYHWGWGGAGEPRTEIKSIHIYICTIYVCIHVYWLTIIP